MTTASDEDRRQQDLHQEDRRQEEEPPPFLQTWRRVYTGVLLYSFALMAILYIISRLLAP